MSEVLRFIHLSDTHFNPDTDYIKAYAAYTPLVGMDALLKTIQALPFKPDFILHTGDVAYDPFPEVYPIIKSRFDALAIPVHYLVGNHDDSASVQTILMGRKAEDVTPYLHYDFEVKGVHVVCLDSNAPHVPENPSGNVSQEQLDWLDDICSSNDERPLVVAVHHNILRVGVPWLDDWMRTENGDAFHAIVRQARDRLRGVFFGHIHQNIEALQDGVLYAAAASPWCQFMSYPIPENTMVINELDARPGFSVVTITPERTFIRRHHFSIEA